MKTTFTFFLMLTLSVSGFSQITFQARYGGADYDNCYAMRPTADGGYILGGQTWSFGQGAFDAYLVKTDAYGNMLWTKTYGGPNFEAIKDIEQTNDGGYILSGRTQSFGAGGMDVWLIKTDASGDTLWTKTYGGANEEDGNSVRQTADGGFIVAGQTNTFGAGLDDIYLIRTDANGDTLWTKTYGGAGEEAGYSIQMTNDSGYIITGVTGIFTPDTGDVFLIKTDSYGNVLWSKMYGQPGDDVGESVQLTADGGYIITGITNFEAPSSTDFYLIKTDANGDTLWTKSYGGIGDDYGYGVQQTTDGGYILGGWTNSFGVDSADLFIIRTDSTGSILWSKIYGGINFEWGSEIQKTADGGFVVAGTTRGFGAGSEDFYLVKTDSLGNSGCNETNPPTIITKPATVVTPYSIVVSSPVAVVTSPAVIVGNGGTGNALCISTGTQSSFNNLQSSISVYPNPISSNSALTFTHSPLDHPGDIIINNIDGKEVGRYHVPEGSTSEKITLPELAKGVYEARLVGEGMSEDVKFVVN
jgi:hypothetical protein